MLFDSFLRPHLEITLSIKLGWHSTRWHSVFFYMSWPRQGPTASSVVHLLSAGSIGQSFEGKEGPIGAAGMNAVSHNFRVPSITTGSCSYSIDVYMRCSSQGYKLFYKLMQAEAPVFTHRHFISGSWSHSSSSMWSGWGCLSYKEEFRRNCDNLVRNHSLIFGWSQYT